MEFLCNKVHKNIKSNEKHFQSISRCWVLHDLIRNNAHSCSQETNI
jgi:hypothetical protein